jgi:hypothetical protein
VAEISAKKLKRGRGKIKLAGRICGRILAVFTKSGRKGAGEYFIKKSSLSSGTDTLSETKKNLNLILN